MKKSNEPRLWFSDIPLLKKLSDLCDLSALLSTHSSYKNWKIRQIKCGEKKKKKT